MRMTNYLQKGTDLGHVTLCHCHKQTLLGRKQYKLEMWANAQRDGRPAEHRWRPLFNAAKFG